MHQGCCQASSFSCVPPAATPVLQSQAPYGHPGSAGAARRSGGIRVGLLDTPCRQKLHHASLLHRPALTGTTAVPSCSGAPGRGCHPNAMGEASQASPSGIQDCCQNCSMGWHSHPPRLLPVQGELTGAAAAAGWSGAPGRGCHNCRVKFPSPPGIQDCQKPHELAPTPATAAGR